VGARFAYNTAKQKRLSQWILALKADLHVNVIGRIERGIHNPTAPVLTLIHFHEHSTHRSSICLLQIDPRLLLNIL
jgi:hypothetical protein